MRSAAPPDEAATSSSAAASARIKAFDVRIMGFSEGDLEATQQQLLVVAVAATGRAAAKVGLLVVERELEVAVRIPVDADGPRARAARGGGGIGERARTAGERLLVERELAHARDQLPRAEPFSAGRERRTRAELPVRGFLAGQHPVERELPRVVLEPRAPEAERRIARDVLRDAHVLAEQAVRAVVPGELRRPAQAPPLGERGRGA